MSYKDYAYIQAQYRDTNIQELLNGIANIKDLYITKAYDSFKQGIDLRYANGVWLDMWGRLLNFSRYVPVSEDTSSLFVNFNFYNRNFVKLKFYDASDITYAALTDSAYRLVLQMLWSSRNIQSNLYEINSLSTEIFQAEIIVNDSMDMKFVTYYFRDEIPQWLQHIIEKYDILPRPCCVATRFVSAIFKYINFLTNDNDFNKKITAFWNSRFYDDEPEEVTRAKDPRKKLHDNLLKNVIDNLWAIYANEDSFKEFLTGLNDEVDLMRASTIFTALQNDINHIATNDNMPVFRAYDLEFLQNAYLLIQEHQNKFKSILGNLNAYIWLPTNELFNDKFHALKMLYDDYRFVGGADILEKWAKRLKWAQNFVDTVLTPLAPRKLSLYHGTTLLSSQSDFIQSLDDDKKKFVTGLIFSFLHSTNLGLYQNTLDIFLLDLERGNYRPIKYTRFIQRYTRSTELRTIKESYQHPVRFYDIFPWWWGISSSRGNTIVKWETRTRDKTVTFVIHNYYLEEVELETSFENQTPLRDDTLQVTPYVDNKRFIEWRILPTVYLPNSKRRR